MDNLSKYVIIEPSILFNESGENFLKKISTPNKAVWQKIWAAIVLAAFMVSSVVFVPRLYGDSQENTSQVLTAVTMLGHQGDLNGTTVEPEEVFTLRYDYQIPAQNLPKPSQSGDTVDSNEPAKDGQENDKPTEPGQDEENQPATPAESPVTESKADQKGQFPDDGFGIEPIEPAAMGRAADENDDTAILQAMITPGEAYGFSIPDLIDLSDTEHVISIIHQDILLAQVTIDDQTHRGSLIFTAEAMDYPGLVGTFAITGCTFDQEKLGLPTEQPRLLQRLVAPLTNSSNQITKELDFGLGQAPIRVTFGLPKAGEEPEPLPDGVLKEIKVSCQDATGNAVDIDNGPVPLDATLLLEYAFELPASDENGFKHGQPYTFAVPVQVQAEIEQEELTNAGVAYGHFSVKNQVVTIEFYEAAEPGATGTFGFAAGISKEELGAGGKQVIIFPLGSSSSQDITITFDAVQPSVQLEVSKQVKEDGLDISQRIITWQVTATPTTGEQTPLTKLVITDVIDTTGQVYGEPYKGKHHYVENSAALAGGGADAAEIQYDEATHTLTCTLDTPVKDQQYVLEYQTQFTVDMPADIKDSITVEFANQAEGKCTWPKYIIDHEGQPVASDSETEGNSVSKESTIVSASVTCPLLDKKGALEAGAADIINWEITVAPGAFQGKANITDTIPAGLTLVKDSVKLGDASIGVPNTLEVTKQEPNGPTTLTIQIDSLTEKQTISYQTKVDSEGFNPEHSFTNHVEFVGNPGDKPYFTYEKDATVNVGSALFGKSGSYDRKTHTINWTIALNQSKSDLQAYTISDQIPDGLTLDPTSIKVSAGEAVTDKSCQYDEGTKTLTFSVEAKDHATYRIQYATVLNDDQNKYWATNLDKGTKPYKNTAIISIGALRYEVPAAPEIISQVISKAPVSYSTAAKEATWDMVINQNEMPMTNVVVTDTPGSDMGQKYVPGSVSVTQKDKRTPYLGNVAYEETTTGIKISFKDEIKEQLTIRLKTKLDEDQLNALCTNETVKISNQATIDSDQIPEPIPVIAEQSIGRSIISKSGKDTKDNKIRWTVIVNENMMPLPKPIVHDILAEALEFDPDSVVLYELAIDNATGHPITNVAEGTKLGDDERKALMHFSYRPETKECVFEFQQDISKAYGLVFDTDVTEEKNQTIENAISMEGAATVSSDKPAQAVFQWRSSFGNINNQLGELIVEKQAADNGDLLLADAEFALEKVSSGAVYTVMTNDKGRAEFPKLRSGEYRLTETQAPAGYRIDADVYPITVVVENKSNNTITINGVPTLQANTTPLVLTNTKITPPTPPVVKTGSMTITKVDGQSGAVLAGAKFALYKAQYPSKAEPGWQLYDQAVTAEATGQAIFADLAYGEYYLQEIAAPAGYVLSETTYPFSIDDQHKELSYRWPNTAKTPDEEEEKPDDETPDNNGGSGGGDDSNNGSSDGSGGGSNNGGGSVLPPSPSETPVPVTPVTPETAVVPEEPSASETPMAPEASNGPVISAEGVVDPSTVDQIIAGITSQDVPTSGKVEVPEGGQADLHYPPSYGTATVELDGSWQYAPEQGFSGRDQFVIKVTNADGEEEFILMDMEVPLAGWLPETGEASRKGIYLVGVLCLLAGCGLLISGKKRQKQSY